MSDVPRQPPPKKDVALALLEESSMFIHLDPRRPHVIVPRSFMGQPQLVLQVGLNMAIPIPDLKVDDDGISCTLSFNRSPFWCRIPWESIYALVGEDGRGGVWAEDVPPEIQRQSASAPQQKPGSKRPRPKLSAVPGGAAEPRPEPPAEDDRRPVPIRRGLVPAPPPRAAAGAELEPDGMAPEAEAAPKPKPAAPSGGKKKREIPPYLRVIK
jgi:hypothetical protein